MKSIYDELLSRVANGERFYIDFEKRNMKIGKEYLIKDGKYDNDKYFIPTHHNANINLRLAVVDDLYIDYKYSMPSERSENKRRKYFKALPVEDLSIEELVNGESREFAQAKLESYILCETLNGNLYWDESWGSFFWQSKINPDLVILRKWIEK